MSWSLFFSVMIAACSITVSGMKIDVKSNLSWPTGSCKSSQGLEDFSQLHVECERLTTLQDVKKLLKEDLWSRIGSLAILKSNLTVNLAVDDLIDYPSLHTLTFKQSKLSEWKKSRIGSLPKLRKLVMIDCWDNGTILGMYGQLTLTLTSELANALPDLEELHLIEMYLPNISILRTMKKLKKVVMEKGAAICAPENLWILEWYDDGKMEMDSTVCFVIEKTSDERETLTKMLPFADVNLMLCLSILQSALDDCPLPCKCELYGFNQKNPSKSPITNVNCSSANLTQLPDLIPSHTSKLFLENNQITDISKIFTSPRYRSLSRIELKNNLVDHIDFELLKKYIHNHSLDFNINLVNNKLETLPAEDLLKMYNHYSGKGHNLLPNFGLAGNQWNCDDCAFLVPFQRMIYYQDLKKEDLQDVKCGKGRYYEGQSVVKVPVKTYCNKDHLDSLDILNICLGTLLILFILNFIYNLIQYQRHGKLPWIVTKVPCC